jgi:precorrin-3B methylase
VLLAHREPGTPVVIGRNMSGPDEEVRVVRLADLDAATRPEGSATLGAARSSCRVI